MNMILKSPEIDPDNNAQCLHKITPLSAGWKYVGFEAYTLKSGTVFNWSSEEREACVVLLTGSIQIVTNDHANNNNNNIDTGVLIGRASVFDKTPPHALYAPHKTKIKISAHTDAQIIIATAPCYGTHPVRYIAPHQMQQSVRGCGTNTRYVTDILPDSLNAADHLLVVEVITPSSHSSSYPPHKHDQDRVDEHNNLLETALEETYFHKVNPAQGFVFQRIYTDKINGIREIDQAYAVECNDVILAPKGYHPVIVPHGYESWYLNVMAGPTRKWQFHNDPEHEFLFK